MIPHKTKKSVYKNWLVVNLLKFNIAVLFQQCAVP